MKYTTILFCGILFCLYSCSNSPKSNLRQVFIPEKHDKSVNIDNLVDSVFTIAVADNVPMFGELDKVLFSDNRIFLREKSILSNTPIKSINFKGAAYKQYGIIGQGPQEYVTAFDFAINNHDNEIWIYDRNQKKLLLFDTESGKLKNIKTLKDYLLQFKILEKDVITAYADEDNDNELVVFDVNSLVRQFGKYTYNSETDIEILRIFAQSKDTTYFLRPASDTIQIVKSNKAVPYLQLNYGKYSIDKEFINMKGFKAKQKYAKRNSLSVTVAIYKSGNNLLFQYLKDEKLIVGLLNRKLQLLLNSAKIKYKNCILPQPIAIWNDFMVFPIHSDIEEYATLSKSKNLTFLFIRIKDTLL